MLLINKAIVDLVIANWGNADFVWRPLIVLVAMRFGMSLVRAVLNQTNLYVSQIFNDSPESPYQVCAAREVGATGFGTL